MPSGVTEESLSGRASIPCQARAIATNGSSAAPPLKVVAKFFVLTGQLACGSELRRCVAAVC